MALGSSAEMTIALTCCVVRVWMYGTWAAPLASDGPTCLKVPPSVLAASWPPEAATSKYALFTCFGRKAMLSLLLVDEELLLPPQAASNMAAAPASEAPRPRF